MSEKTQHTACTMREKMLARYGELYHKHNKNHLHYRKHYRSHPCVYDQLLESEDEHRPTGLSRNYNLRKLRKKSSNRHIH